jgi:hypothetical protein
MPISDSRCTFFGGFCVFFELTIDYALHRKILGRLRETVKLAAYYPAISEGGLGLGG